MVWIRHRNLLPGSTVTEIKFDDGLFNFQVFSPHMALKKDGKGAVVGQWHQKYMEIDFDSGKAKPFPIQNFDMIYADCEMYC